MSSIVSNQVQPALSNDSGGGLLLTWYDDQRGLPTSLDIFAQHISPSGDGLWYPSGVPVCRAQNQGAGLCIAQNGGGAGDRLERHAQLRLTRHLRAGRGCSIGRLGSGVDVEPSLTPAATALARPAPNPAPHGSTNISYTLSSPRARATARRGNRAAGW